MYVVQSCLTLCNLVDCSPPGSSVHGILQARILERKQKKKNNGAGCHSLLQGIFQIWRSNPGLPHCRQSSRSEPPGKPLAISKTLISEGHGVHMAPHLLYEKRGLECISGLQCEKAERKASLGDFIA